MNLLDNITTTYYMVLLGIDKFIITLLKNNILFAALIVCTKLNVISNNLMGSLYKDVCNV